MTTLLPITHATVLDLTREIRAPLPWTVGVQKEVRSHVAATFSKM
jgi:hypothetical protein